MPKDRYITDGTIVVLYCKPGKNGDAYYTQEANYGLNVQVCVHVTISALFNFFLDWEHALEPLNC